MEFRFKNPIKLNKSFILSNITEEQIMSFYLKIPLGRKKLFCSPLRKDKSVTCSVFRSNKGTLLFKDFATGEALNCFEIVKRLFNCNYFEALRIIANDFGIIRDKSLRKNPGKINSNSIKLETKETSKIQIEVQDFTDLELKWWAKYGITPEILKRFNVYSCKHVFLNGQLVAKSQQHCPIFGYYGGKIKENEKTLELWRCYFPQRKTYRFLSNWPAKKLQGYKQLPKKGKLCVITKSMKDCLALYAYGIPACAPNSEVVIPSEAIIKDLTNRFEHIFVLWDNDQTGVTFINKFKKQYPQLKYLIIPRHLEAKDFSDLRAKYGYKKTKEFIIQYLKSIK